LLRWSWLGGRDGDLGEMALDPAYLVAETAGRRLEVALGALREVVRGFLWDLALATQIRARALRTLILLQSPLISLLILGRLPLVKSLEAELINIKI
jgi:hypothetical protein